MSSSRKPKTINPDDIDPSVYYYDEVYDEMKDEDSKSHEKKHPSKEKDKGSKYIDGMIQMAELRKVDKEIRKFKKHRTSDEAVGRDEDVYITKSYRKKLDEIEALERDRQEQSEREKEKSLNFLRGSHDRSRSSHTSHSKKGDQNSEKVKGESKTEEPVNASQAKSSGQPGSSKQDRLASFEDRKAYLKKVLAKRTVGKLYNEAVDRYMQRKAMLHDKIN